MKATENQPETNQSFVCEFCDYSTSKKYNYDQHILTLKHINATQSTENKHQNSTHHICEFCNKNFTHRSGLWRHKKNCNEPLILKEDKPIPNDDNIKNLTQLVLEVVKSNSELQKQSYEMQKSLVDLCKQGTMNQYNLNNHQNSHNKTFNLQVFLNETCKDAMNLTDFVNSLQIDLTDLENVGKNGFVAGISHIILKNLKALDITQRPVHCSDHKREVIYVKDANEWFNDSKEEPHNQKLKKAIKQIAHKNICMIPEWKTEYPDCVYSESTKSDLYNHIMYEAMDHNDANSEKIIKKIAKEVGIDPSFKKGG